LDRKGTPGGRESLTATVSNSLEPRKRASNASENAQLLPGGWIPQRESEKDAVTMFCVSIPIGVCWNRQNARTSKLPQQRQ
jgi:hypothetical protein